MSFPYVLSKGFRRTQHSDRHNSFDTLDFSPKRCNIKSCTCSSASPPKSVYVTVSLTVPQMLFLWHNVYYRFLVCLCACYPPCHWGRGWIPCKQTMKPESSNWGFSFIPADSLNSELSNPLWYPHLPSPLYPLFFLSMLNNAKWFVWEKSHWAPCSFTSMLAVFWCVAAERSCFPEMPVWRRRREGQVYFCLPVGGVQQIFPYVPTTQHLVCDFKMKQRPYSRTATSKATWDCAKPSVDVFCFFIPQTKLSEPHCATWQQWYENRC